LEVHPYRCVSRSFKREIDRRKLLSTQTIWLAPRCTAPGRYRHAPRLADERRHPTLVRGPKHIIKRGKTPVLTAAEARQLLDSIDTGSLIGLRDPLLLVALATQDLNVFRRARCVLRKLKHLFLRHTHQAAL
jgi:hypothetical protein